MAGTTFYLVLLKQEADSDAFISGLSALRDPERPSWIGKCLHWVHEPHLSVKALQGSGERMKTWDYLLVFPSIKMQLPNAIEIFVADGWSISSASIMVDAVSTPRAAKPIELRPGWSAEDCSGLDAAESPADLEMTLAVRSHAFGSTKSAAGTPLRDTIRALGTSSPGPIAMFGLLSYLPGQRERYFQYVDAFSRELAPANGGEPLVVATGATDWSSKAEVQAGDQEGEWEDFALIYYPSIWHFGNMLAEPLFAELDRRYKLGAVRNNALMCCTEVPLRP